MNIYLIAGFALAIGGGAAWLRRKRRQVSLQALSERQSLSDAEIYKQFYAGGNFDVAEVRAAWNEIVETLRVPAYKLRPTDKFGTDTGVSLITSEELDTLAELAAKRAARQGKEVDISALATVDDYVKAFATSSAHS
ncbi:hypothetical protein PI87_14335 [Ralstonia sp. A12]|uniref:LPXTG cell wall anchor domain-containing protein n=1 Tax=Ralstonia sp. A12 TaxID=1217052 RepID=UPI0005738491|nr:LPXTG cell wall anchor domain-containing protein [Ralstonia sp. A12]KHK54780.1 hypothetical protein PI87_14335 [Ralstonia sp. A12]